MKIGVFGQSSIGQRHARLIRDAGHDVVTCDPVRPADETDPAAVWPKIDAVVIATPPLTHLALAQEAARRRLPMLIEKPLGVPEEIETWRQVDGRRLLLGYQWRYAPELARVCAEPATIITAEYYGAFGARDAAWLRDPAAGGGVLLEYSHALDYALWAGGDGSPEDVLALIAPNETMAMVRLWNRATVFLASEGPPRATLTADGREWARLQTDLPACYAAQTAHFLAVCEGRAPRVGLAHGLRVLEIVDKARRSHGEWV